MRNADPQGAGVRQGTRGQTAQSSSPSESLLELELLFELEFELLLELEFEFELELLLLLLLEFEFEFELLFELLSEFELLFEFELLDPCSWCPFISFFQKPPRSSSSAMTGAANDVATKATVAILVRVFIGGVLPCEKQPSLTASGKRTGTEFIPRSHRFLHGASGCGNEKGRRNRSAPHGTNAAVLPLSVQRLQRRRLIFR
jgi:hypothetical protein